MENIIGSTSFRPAMSKDMPDFGRSPDFTHSIPSQWPDYMVGQPGQPVRVLVVDDDAHMRKVVSNELLADLRCDLVAQAGSMREGRRMILQHEFDVMLVDLNLGDGSGLALIEHMKIVRPMAEAIVISAMDDEHNTLRAFELGATGYLVKNSWFGNFPQAVLQVVNGGASITPSLARRLLQKLEPSPEVSGAPACEARDKLSEREKGVLKMVAAGYTSIEIGMRLTISCQTVNTHIKNIYRKLQVRTRAQAVSYAAHRGML
jgi:DNA-binding NarL/FixJ family response regulator